MNVRNMLLFFSALVLLSVPVLSACSQKTQQSAKRMENCPASVEKHTTIINTSKRPRDVAAAYFKRGQCNKELGNLQQAYEDFYVSTAMCCFLVKNDKTAKVGVSMGEVVLNGVCESYGPQNMRALEKQLSQGEVTVAKENAMKRVPAKYFQGM